MKTKTTLHFVSSTDITSAIKGRYGIYARLHGLNYSEKEMTKLGYELRELSDDEASSIADEIRLRREAMRKQDEAMEMERRANQVALCLSGEPLTIGEGNHLWEHIINLEGAMLEAYSGCGLATAYILDGKIIAWHYGNTRPTNAPECDYVQLCEVSCCQILF